MIRVERSELAGIETQAILRPVTADWAAVTPAMRRLEVAAGRALEQQCRSLGELPVGSAVVTGAGDLPVEFMVHVCVRSIEQPVSSAGVRRALVAGLRRLEEWGIGRVAMPLLGTGAGNLDAEDAAALLVSVLNDATAAGRAPAEVVIVADSDYEETAILSRLEGPVEDTAGPSG
ncbi:MAG: macro domain-containing protein [Longimicrobiales bacterium]